MTFAQNRNTYIKKCEKLSDLYLNLALQFKHLGLSLNQYGVTQEIRDFIDKRIKIEEAKK